MCQKKISGAGRFLILLLCMLLTLLFITGCGDEQAVPESQVPSSDSQEETQEAEEGEDFVPYEAPEFKSASYRKDKAEGNGQASIDCSSLAKGYVAASAKSDKRLKFQVIKGDTTYNYDLSSDGTPSVFPLQSGNGTYTFRVMENVGDTKYACIYSAEKSVELRDEFQPFLRPSDYVNYNKESKCVLKAQELASHEQDALGVVSAIFEYICDTVKYDHPKAESVQSGYLPNPDETMETGKGICLDYAALGAAMMRSQGIPVKMVFGYVSPDDLYHAWNMFYTEETGWVTVKFEAKGKEWTRMDITFSANGADMKFIGNGENYADVYYY